jgi:hypothetical protein
MEMVTIRNARRAGLIAIAALMLLGVGGKAYGLLFLQDQNSSVTIDPNSQHGMFDWIIDGVNLAPVYGAVGGDDDYRQWFWYRVGNTPEASIDTLNLNSALAYASPPTGPINTAYLSYSTPVGLKFEITYTLNGSLAGSGQSDIGEQIRITNNGSLATPLSFYQYSDFMLDAPVVGNEVITFLNANTVQETGASGYILETVHTPVAQHQEAEAFPVTINKLNDLAAGNLVDNLSATGDVTWAYQWDYTLAPNQSVLISKDKLAVVPEPSTVLLAIVGLLGVSLARRRR